MDWNIIWQFSKTNQLCACSVQGVTSPNILVKLWIPGTLLRLGMRLCTHLDSVPSGVGSGHRQGRLGRSHLQGDHGGTHAHS